MNLSPKIKLILSTMLILLSFESFSQAVVTKEDHVSDKNLTDQDKWTSENYVHEGLSNRTLEEHCKSSDEKSEICSGGNPNAKSENMVKALTQMYTLVVTTMPGMDKITYGVKPDDAAKDATNTSDSGEGSLEAAENSNVEKTGDDATKSTEEAKKEESTDYCRYIATGTETIALFQQQLSQKNIGMNLKEETAQKEALEKAYLSHKERAKTAKMQFIGWGATSACYVGVGAMNSFYQMDWKYYLKMGAASALTIYFKGVVSDHEGYMDQVRSIKDRLPGKGNCNPITDNACYCSQPETEWDTKYCMKQIHKKQIAENSVFVSCLDENLNADEDCSCEASNSCYDKKILKMAQTQFSAPGVVNPSTFNSFAKMTTGELVNGKLSGVPDSNLNAIANKVLKSKDLNLVSTKPFTKDQKDVYKGLKELGMSESMAKSMAAVPFGSAQKKNLAKFKNAKGVVNKSGSYAKNSNSSGSNVITFGGGSGINQKKKSKSNNSMNFNKILNRYNKKSKKTKSGNVLKFAQRAHSSAGITKDKSKSIFDIVSRRYRVSGTKRVETQK